MTSTTDARGFWWGGPFSEMARKGPWEAILATLTPGYVSEARKAVRGSQEAKL